MSPIWIVEPVAAVELEPVAAVVPDEPVLVGVDVCDELPQAASKAAKAAVDAKVAKRERRRTNLDLMRSFMVIPLDLGPVGTNHLVRT